MKTNLLAACAVLMMAATAQAQLTSGDITAWYRLQGDAMDNSGNGFNGTGGTFVADPDRGMVAAFDGTATGAIDVSSSGYSVVEQPEPGQFSIGFWVKPNARNDLGTSPAANPIMGGTGSTRGVIEIVGNGSWNGMGGGSANGGVGVNSGGGGGSTGKVGAIDLYDGDWHHVLIQWVDPDGTIAGNTGADAEVYIDGILGSDVNGGTYSGVGGSGTNFALGGPLVYSNGGAQDKYFDGLLSDVVFFDRQLNQDEVLEAMQLGNAAAVPEPASIALWSLIGVGLAGFGLWRRRGKK